MINMMYIDSKNLAILLWHPMQIINKKNIEKTWKV